MTLTVRGFAQIFFRLRQLVLLVIDPAETIQVCAVVGIQRHSLLNHGSRFFQPHPAVGQHVTVIIQHRGIVRVYA